MKVITIDEESFKDKTLEVINSMVDNGGPHIGIVAILAFIELRHKLFHPQEESEEKGHE